MDKSDYSEVKELITTNSNCPTNNSHFDGDSVVFYGAAKDDSFQKGAGHLRSFRKVGADNASRHELKGNQAGTAPLVLVHSNLPPCAKP